MGTNDSELNGQNQEDSNHNNNPDEAGAGQPQDSSLPGGEIIPEDEMDQPMGAAEPVIESAEGDKEFTGIPHAEIPAPGIPAFDERFRGIPAGAEIPEPFLDLPADKVLLSLLVKRQYIEKFWNRTEEAQKRINDEVDNLVLANSLMKKIQQSRNYLLAGKEYIEEADCLLSEVEHRLNFIQRVKKMTRTTAPWLLVYELAWLVVLVLVFRFLFFSSSFLNNSVIGNLTIQLDQLFLSMIWGGVGGVVGGLFALWRHVADLQDFDKQYSIWYITSPILGLPLGAFIFLVIQAGFFTLTAGSPVGQTISSALIIYVLAWIGGFKQNVVFDLTRRILEVFQVQAEKEPKTELETQATPEINAGTKPPGRS